MLKKVLLAILDNFEGYVSQVLLAFFVLILLLQIFLRQFGHPLYWTEELARYSFVWFVFFLHFFSSLSSLLDNTVTLFIHKIYE